MTGMGKRVCKVSANKSVIKFLLAGGGSGSTGGSRFPAGAGFRNSDFTF